MRLYLIRAWDSDNRQWDGAFDSDIGITPRKREAERWLRSFARDSDTPQSDYDIVVAETPEELSHYTGIQKIGGGVPDNYEQYFHRAYWRKQS